MAGFALLGTAKAEQRQVQAYGTQLQRAQRPGHRAQKGMGISRLGDLNQHVVEGQLVLHSDDRPDVITSTPALTSSPPIDQRRASDVLAEKQVKHPHLSASPHVSYSSVARASRSRRGAAHGRFDGDGIVALCRIGKREYVAPWCEDRRPQ